MTLTLPPSHFPLSSLPEERWPPVSLPSLQDPGPKTISDLVTSVTQDHQWPNNISDPRPSVSQDHQWPGHYYQWIGYCDHRRILHRQICDKRIYAKTQSIYILAKYVSTLLYVILTKLSSKYDILLSSFPCSCRKLPSPSNKKSERP
jgi:hypothetical protein